MRHRLAPKAAADIRRLYAQGAETFGADQADCYALGLDRTFEFLAQHPRAGRLRSELEPPVRVYRYKSHLIFYDLGADDIVIIQRVRHGHEDWISDPL